MSRCLIDAISNKVISNKAPATYLAEIADILGEEKLGQVLRSHFLPSGDSSALRCDPVNVDRFHEERFALLLPAISDFTGAELAKEVAVDAYLDPARPFSNDLALKRIVRTLKGRIFWWEQHMNRKILEVLIDDLDPDKVMELRLLSGPANISPKTKKAFERFVVEMSGRGVDCAWRVIPAYRARDLHAPVLFDDETTYELPPLNSLYKGTVDSIRSSSIPHEPFEQAWLHEAAIAVDAFEPTE